MQMGVVLILHADFACGIYPDPSFVKAPPGPGLEGHSQATG